MNLFKNIDEVISVGQIPSNSLINADCLEGMKYIADKSIDMVLCDLPYGTTACKWDIIIPFEHLWLQYERIIKPNGVILLFGTEPFTSSLIHSNKKLFRYRMIWNRVHRNGYLNSKKRPMTQFEDICMFSKVKLGNSTYNPQFTDKPVENIRPPQKIRKPSDKTTFGKVNGQYSKDYDVNRLYPSDIISINSRNKECNSLNRVHPTQKPVELFEYLIKTYTNEGELVLDNTAGSGTTAIACLNTNRQYILMEQEQSYYEIGLNRIKEWHKNKSVNLF